MNTSINLPPMLLLYILLLSSQLSGSYTKEKEKEKEGPEPEEVPDPQANEPEPEPKTNGTAAADIQQAPRPPISPAEVKSLPCVPSSVSGDYEKWTALEKLEFGICFENDSSLAEGIKNKTEQMTPTTPAKKAICYTAWATWAKIAPGVNDIDYFDEFHEDIPLPPEYLAEGRTKPKSVRVLNQQGFDYLAMLLKGGTEVCDTLRPDHLPLECANNLCQCRSIVPNEGNDCTIHFSSFREKKKSPVQLFYDPDSQNCTFPDSKECTVQPNENKPGGYKIPCHDPEELCAISGNDVLCTRRNMTKTIDLYNEFAYKIKETLHPYRKAYPIACECTDRPLKSEIPSKGFDESVYEEQFGYHEGDAGSDDKKGDGDENRGWSLMPMTKVNIFLMIASRLLLY